MIHTTPRPGLVDFLIRESAATTWEGVLKEWKFYYTFERSEPGCCPCGQRNVKRWICIINKQTGKQLHVGYNCGSNFFSFDPDGVLVKVVNHAFKARKVTLWEYNFLKSIAGNPRLSQKQRLVYDKLKVKLQAVMV